MTKQTKGTKGGLSIFSPETIGAMTGAAIGGLTGLVLGSKKAKEKLANAAEKALGKGEVKAKETNDEAEL